MNRNFKKIIVIIISIAAVAFLGCRFSSNNEPTAIENSSGKADLEESGSVESEEVSPEVDEDKKMSTADIDSKSLMQHIDFVIALAGENNISFGFIEDEWDRLLNQAGIIK